MTTTTQPARPRWVAAVLTALIAVGALFLAAGTASATTAPAAENRIRASASTAQVADRPPQDVSADQRLGNSPARADFVVATGVAAKSVPEIKAGVSGGETAGKAFPRSVKNEAIDENLAATGAQSPTCVWCHMETSTPHIDHAWPRSLGGDATLPNAQVACPHCNMSRGNGPSPVTPPEGYLGPWPPAWWPNG